jgi:hypothetical protein
MHSKVARRTLAILAIGVLALVLQGVTTMATNSLVKSTKSTTSATALAPHTHAQPVEPSTVPSANWRLQGKPSSAKQAVNGVGPAPGPKTVGYAALQAIASGGKLGASLDTIQQAITAVGLRGKHPVMPLLTWLANKRGYTFVCVNGMVTLG